MKIRVLGCYADGKTYAYSMDNDLEAFQEAVGGYIECVTLGFGTALICNEEGKLRGLPVNPYATFYARNALKKRGCEFNDVIVGDAVIVGVTDDGDFGSLSPGQMAWLRQSDFRL